MPSARPRAVAPVLIATILIATVLAAASAQAADVVPARGDGVAPARGEDLRAMVEQDCGSCHGLNRLGGLGSPLTTQALADRPIEAVTAAILDGRPGTPMPPWRGLLTEEEADWIAHLLKGENAHVR